MTHKNVYYTTELILTCYRYTFFYLAAFIKELGYLTFK